MAAPNFSEVDAKLGDYELFYYKGERRRTSALKLRPTRQDTGQNANQLRPEYGDYFSQNRFLGGQEQEYFHTQLSEEDRIYYSEGIDFSDGRVRPLYRVQPINLVGSGGFSAVAGGGRLTIADDKLFVIADLAAIRRMTTLGGATTDENPHAADGTTDIYDITARGNEVFAALGANGIHRRDPTAGTWAHWQPDGATDLTIGDARLVQFVKDRIMAAGTGGREMFEVVNDSTPSVIVTLPTGWVFTDIGESGQFIYATAESVGAGLSRVHVFGLNSAGTAIEHKGSTPMATDQFARSIEGYLDAVFVGAGKRNQDGGFDPVFWIGTPSENGLLKMAKIAEGKGAGALDLSVRAIHPDGEQVFCSWALGDDSPYGKRTGIAVYDLARGAFFHHMSVGGATARSPRAITRFKGHLLHIPELIYWEDPNQGWRNGFPGEDVYLVTSIADWGAAGLKVWDLYDLRHKSLGVGASIDIYYTIDHPRENNWTLLGTSDTDGDEGATFRETDIISRQLSLKIVLLLDDPTRPEPAELESFSVRSVPTTEVNEFTLERYVRLIHHDRKDSGGPERWIDPDTRNGELRALLRTWATLYEEDGTWDVWIDDFSEVIPGEPLRNVDNVDVTDDSYILKLTMIGREA